MIQQQTKLCFATMKIVQLPTLVRGVTKVLWPSYLKRQPSILPYRSSSTVTQVNTTLGNATKPSEEKVGVPETIPNATETENGEEKIKEPEKEKKIDAAPTPSPPKAAANPKSEPLGTEMDAVLKVKSLAAALEACALFTTKQRIDVLKNLAAAKTRPIPLIQTLTEGIAKSPAQLDIKVLSDLLFALAKLNYINEDVLMKTCEDIKKQVKEVRGAAVLGSAMHSLRVIQWKDEDLLNEVSLWIQNHSAMFQYHVDFVYTLALLNHSPPNLDDLLQCVWRDVLAKKRAPSELVTLVWSISALNCKSHQKVTKDTLSKFFTKKFQSELRLDQGAWMKLLNLHAVAKASWGQVELNVPQEVVTALSNAKQTKGKRDMILECTQLLFKTLDTTLYATNVPSGMGFTIDLVFCLDDKLNAIPLHLATRKSTRVAMMVHTYQECVHPVKEPSGVRAFQMRLLQEDYTVVSVPYSLLSEGSSQAHEYFNSILSNIARARR